ncbi:chaperonin 10-like protein [Dichotomocladium elegans]|nr:chaperonin 10-like protein [Dichotomocladium elegans]
MTGDLFNAYGVRQAFNVAEGKTCLERISFKPLPLADDEVEILVSACGICGSDVHQLTNGWKSAIYPLVPGHEFIGPVTAVGQMLRIFKVGDRVGVSPIRRSCGTCEECTTSNGQLCSPKS